MSVLDTNTLKWELIEPVAGFKIDRRYHSAFMAGDSMVIHGGIDSVGNIQSDTLMYTFSNNTFEKLEVDNSIPIAYHTAALVYYTQQLNDPSFDIEHIPVIKEKNMANYKQIKRKGVYMFGGLNA